jgi:NAD(P)-dependent dehydrogenase (short-subunit alcohol dehydrogenase family)
MTKTALITGGAAGIGRATADLFASRGFKIIVADREAADTTGTNLQSVQLDITDENSVLALFRDIGPIDVLVNNAGIGDNHLRTVDQDIDHFRKVLDVHLSGTFLMAREAAKRMKSTGGGSIVNLSSIAGVVGLPRRNAYGAAKAGISMMTKSLACEWAADNIRVNAVAPGYTRTALVDRLIQDDRVDETAICKRTPMGRFMQPQEIAEAIWFLASPAASAITGVTLSVDGGWAAFGDFGDAS